MSTIKHYADLDLRGSLVYGQPLTAFPASPRMNEQILKDGVLWMWTTVQGVTTWMPLTNKKATYVHTQGAPAATWRVQHGLNTTDFVIAIYDEVGNQIISAAIINVLPNEFTLDFAGDVISGRCVMFAETEMFVPALNSESINANALNIANGTVTANGTGLFINGQSVPTTQGLAVVASTGSYADLSNKPTAASFNAVTTDRIGAANGVASLDSNGLVPSSQLPSYVDDVLEFANANSLPAVGEAGKIYVTLDNNLAYRWGGSVYVEISSSPGTTDAVIEGSLNLYFTNARAAAAAPVQSVAGKTGAVTLVASDVSGISVVGKTGLYADLMGSPTIPTVPTSVSAFTNDSGYITSAQSPVQSVAGRTGDVNLSVNDINGLAAVASSGSYNDLSNKPASYSLPPATTTVLGGVKVGSNLSISNGVLSAADPTVTLTGDVTGTGTGSFATTLSASGVASGSYGSSSLVPIITVDTKGRVTDVSTAAIPSGSLSFTGDVSGAGTTGSATALTLATVTQVATGTSFVKVGLDTKGRVTSNAAVAQADITGLLGAGSITNTMLTNSAVANLSGTNTGDETLATIKTKLGISTLSGSNTGDQTITLTGDVSGSGTGSFATTLATVSQGATGTSFVKVGLDTKGRVTSNTAVSQADITGLLGAGSITNTMLANTAVGNLSGVNTGDETATTIKTKLGITTLSGSNTGDQTNITGNAATATALQNARAINGVSFNGSLDITINAVDATPRVASSLLGVANGVATLDSSGYLNTAQLPPSVVGGMNYQGTWNATTNTPTLVSGVGTKGWYYKVSVAGTTPIDGLSQWNVGDMIVFDGVVWDKIDGVATEVTSVAGRVGAVVLTSTDVGLNNVTNVAQLPNTQTHALTGDVTAPATALNTGTIATTLATVTQGSTGTSFVKVGLDTKGRVTSNTAVVQADITALLGTGSITNAMIANTAVTNLSGTNTGDETLATIKTKLGITTLSGSNTGDQTITLTGDVTGSGTGSFAATLATVTQVATGTTFVKVGLDTKGRVVSNVAVAQADITGLLGAGSITNTMLANAAVTSLSGTNTGDETLATLKTKLGITTLSGSNTGDQTITLTGDVTGTGTGTFAATLATISQVATGTTFVKVGLDTKGRVTSNVAVAQADITGLLGAGSITNTMLANSAVTIGSTAISLGNTSLTLSGLTSVAATTFTGALTGNASTATTLQTARNINGVSFNGSADITVAAAAGTLTGTTLAAGVTASSLTSVGTLTAVNTSGAVSLNGLGSVNSATLTTATTAAGQVVDNVALTSYRAVTYKIAITSGSAYQFTEVRVMHDGANVFISETNTLLSGTALATFTADISGGNMRLLTTPVNAVTVYKAISISVAI